MDDGNDTVPGTVMAPPTAVEGDPTGSIALPRGAGERYRVVHRLGKGGMGEVMAVRDDTMGREVALKRIRKADPSDRVVQRFLREASIQGRLEHPAIVPVHDLGYDQSGLPFFIMKKLTGTTMAKILDGARGEFTLQRLLRAFAEVCLAVEFAHVRGIIHRDLKPDNIALGDFGEVYVLDWGVAKVIGEADGEFADISSGVESGELATLPGMTIGTPGYMAPEQVRGTEIDARVDVYALGCILYEILTGAMLHPKGKEGLQSAVSGLVDARPSLRTSSVPPELDELCVQATALDREHRIATARELGDRVQRFLDGDRDLAMRRQLARDHLAKAHGAFAAGDPQRALAMREAGSALALDPTLDEAAQLVARLMLEPPRETPDEVREAIHLDDVRRTQDYARVGLWTYFTFLAFAPLAWWIAPAGSPYPAVLLVLVLLNMGLCWWGAKHRTERKEGMLAVANALLLAAVARMFTPILIAPALAAMSAMAIMFTPTTSRLTSAIGITSLSYLAVLGPWLLERIGVLARTISVDAHGVMLDAPALAGREGPTLTVAALYVVALLASAALLARQMRTRERAAKRHLHLQAWQLRQLVPH